MGTTESTLASNDSTRPPTAASRQQPSSTAFATPRRPSAARRPRLVPTVTLNGLVLGLTGSGKRTLLQRLSGKDPFGDGSEDTDAAPTEITIPYQPPPNTIIWDRIQLNVTTKPSNDHVDFCVLLINPRHDARSLRPYIANLLTKLLQQQQDRPPCLCFLLNFRDLQGDRYTRIQAEAILEWTNDVLEQHSVDEDIMIQCISTSLKNCYGLSNLHAFIYKVYLLYKQGDLQQRLAQVEAQLERANAGSSEEMPYEAFLQVLQQAQHATAAAENGEEDVDYASSDMQSVNDVKAPSSSQEKQESRRDGRSSKAMASNRQEPQTPNRSILPTKYTNTKQSLDAFFADDDDDEEENIVTPVTSHHAPHQNRNQHNVVVDKESTDQDDEDEDDDFFYDEGGHRHQHGVVMDSSDEEEASVESRESQIAHARERSIIDESDESDGVDDTGEVDGGTISHSNTSREKTSKIVSAEERDGDRNFENEVEEEDGGAGENGWDDDDIDIGDSDDEPSTPMTANSSSGELKKPQDAESQNGEGGGDEDTPILAKEPPEKDSAPVETGGGKSNDDSEDNHEDENPVAKDSDASGVNVRLDHSDASETEIPTDSSEDKDHAYEQQRDRPTEANDGGVTNIEASQVVEETQRQVSQAEPSLRAGDESDDDDDDFVVEDTTTSASPQARELQPTQPTLVEKDAEPSTARGDSPQVPSSSGISAAALAAIAAAEKEAKLMMEDEKARDEPSHRIIEKKKSKKKKDPEAKKKKKKHKEKRRSDDE